MCGIAGIFNFSSPVKPIREGNLKNMLSSIRHRGPDESGMYVGNNIGIGNVRLSIIDLAGGQQPLSDCSGRYWIVYNGELFNYIEIKKNLEKKGVQFHTNSDTEVVVAAYAKYGAKCLDKFNGQFAIAIWDKKKQELFLARDRVGIRPLFYTKHKGSLYFCSEIKGIFENPEIPRVISPKGLSQVFTFWAVISPNTPFRDIFEVPPGSYILVDRKGFKINKYWAWSFLQKDNSSKQNLEESVEELRELFSDAVKIRLRADVQVAAYLSGGLDSSITTSFIQSANPDILNTFSIGFKDKAFDETGYQLEASKYFNTRHFAYPVSDEEIAESFVETIRHTESPILRTSPTPMYLLSKKVRENNIKVVITGEGADEMFAGYNIFKEAKIRRFWAREPKSAIRPLLLSKLYPYLPQVRGAKLINLKFFFGYKLSETGNPYYSHLLRWHNTSRIRNYFSGETQNGLSGYDPMDEIDHFVDPAIKNWGNLEKSQYLESSIFMSSYLLSSQGDRMAMANSVEGRYPFLDHRIIELASRLPDDFKLNGLNEKFILKKMMGGKIPGSILKRSKQAYRAPIASSFFGNKKPEYVKEVLSNKELTSTGIFDPYRVGKLIERMEKGPNQSEMDNMAITGIISTQLLHGLFVNNKPKVYPPSYLPNLRIVRETNT
ncbi:MAG: asparagine synthase (glutamine-hydrolyzing) [Chlorobi bacterium]|nr:asparagine synthase (glutamine-hydrolyzing) [Chlorobiota bacterium]